MEEQFVIQSKQYRITKDMSSSSQPSTTGDVLEFDSKISALFNHKGYKIMNKLGQGAYGKVYKAMDSSGRISAVKVMDLSLMSENFRNKFLPRELSTLIECRHENLIQVWDIFRASNKIFIFMEFAGNGDLAGYLKKHNPMEDSLSCLWFLQTSRGLSFLHERMLSAHRDIKLDNMLLDGQYVAKLTDFGFAKPSAEKERRQVLLSRTFCGTSPYKAPQVLARKPYNGFKADVWSMGVSLFLLFHRQFPFCWKDRPEQLRQIADYPDYIRSRYRQDLPEDAKTLLDGMFNPDEKARSWIKTIRNNKWLLNMSSTAILPTQ